MVAIFKWLWEMFMHLDKNLASIISQYGGLTYGFLFLIIFMETGFVVTPFLPGDSLIFAAAAIAASSSLNIWLLYVLFLFAAIVGDTVNYWIGHYIGPKIFQGEHRFIKKEYLVRTQKFFDKHGGKAISIGRFVPIIRTFVPFVAGVGKMSYKHFIFYNIVGGFAWVTLFTITGYFFGNLSFVKENFHYIVLAIIAISVIPVFYELLKARQKVTAGH